MKSSKQEIVNCIIGNGTKINNFVNLYGCKIGKDCMIGTFVEIQADATIGNKVKVQSHSFICSGASIEDNVFIGHHVVFVNDNHPRATNPDGTVKGAKDWEMTKTIVKKGASIGSNVTILGGITIGENAMVGAGSVVTKDVSPNTTVIGVPAKPI